MAGVTPHGDGGDYLPVRQLQEALTVWFGSHAMARTCGAQGCSGTWDTETESLLNVLVGRIGSAAGTDRVTARYLGATGSMIWLPWGLHNWVTQNSAGYQSGRTYTGAIINQPQQLTTPPSGGASATPWLLCGAAALLLIGGAYWKRGRR